VPLTPKQRLIVAGAWRSGVSVFCGAFLSEGFIQGVGTWSQFGKAIGHGTLIGTVSFFINELRYWKQWAENDPPSTP
jgi:hypothetical protein